MKSHSPLTFLLAGVVLFWVLAAERVSAQVLEVVNEHYLIEADYDKEQAFAGNKNLKLKVTMKTAAFHKGRLHHSIVSAHRAS